MDGQNALTNWLKQQKRRKHRIIAGSWILSMILNVVLLFVLTLLPQRLPTLQEDGLQVDMFSLPDQPAPKRRVAKRPRLTHFADTSVKIAAPQEVTTPRRAVSLITHARQVVRTPDEPVLTAPDETSLADRRDLPVELVARGDVSIQNRPMTAGVNASRGTGNGVDAPRRSEGWLDKIRGEAGEGPQADVRGSGQEVSGYYYIATVRYEDTADAIRAQALSRLVMAMNRWTKIRTQLIPDTTPLDDPAIQRIPLVYIAAQSAFSFSEQERANLRAYLQNGGTLLFSDISPEWGTQSPVANSIRFELWKILGDAENLRPIEREDAVSNTFFQFKKGAPRPDKKRGEFYVLSLNGRIAVFYDAAGLGLKWMENDDDEKWLQWGVNLIVYTLTAAQPAHE
jgi:hypothetical protein